MRIEPNTHTYKPERWLLALNVFSLVFLGIVMGVPLTALALLVASLAQAGPHGDSLAIFFGCLTAPLILLMGFNILQLTLSTILSFFSYVKISPDGIEQKQLPYRHIRCKWSDVDRLGKYFLFSDVVYLNSYEVIGLSLSLKSPLRFFRPRQGFISLSGFDGWRDGRLARDLQQHAPRLFDDPFRLQGIQPGTPEPQRKEMPAVSQENRLLAAFSHAAVILSSTGVLIPIVIYTVQKDKASFTGFQALQALAWQIAASVFNAIVSTCLVGAVLIPVLLTTSSQDERLLALFTRGGWLVPAAGFFLLLLGNLAFVIYGILGAVRTYQGKDFRYAFIGSRIDRSLFRKKT